MKIDESLPSVHEVWEYLDLMDPWNETTRYQIEQVLLAVTAINKENHATV